MPHKKLEIWKQGVDFVVDIYEVTKGFPKEETFGLTQQMRKAVVSVPSNIAEGCAIKGIAETIQFVYISIGSLSELETQLIISNRVGYITSEKKLETMLSKLKDLKYLLIKFVQASKRKQ